MPKQFTSINEMDMGGGIDAQSPETNIPESFASDIKDMDPQPRGSISKRKGFEAIGGSLPIRVNAVTNKPVSNEICFELDESIDTTQLRDRPILVSGISYNGSDYDRDENAETWFPSTQTEIGKTLLASTPLVITSAEHGFSHDKLMIQVKEDTPAGNELFLPDSIVIDSVTYDITINHNSTVDIPVFIVILSSPDELGVSYSKEDYAAELLTSPTSILAATHQLSHVQIIAEISLKLSGSDDWTSIYEDTLTINSSGDVIFDFTSAPGVAGDVVRILLRAADITNIVTGTIAPATTATIDIVNPDTAFQLASVWVEDGTDLVRVLPDSVIYDVLTDTTEVTFVNPGAGESFEIYWEDVALESSEICVDGQLATPGEWTDPDSVIWGITDFVTQPFSTQNEGRAGFAHHLSIYTSQGLRFPVTSMMGSPMNLSTDSIEELFPRMSSRVASDQNLVPFFHDPGQGGEPSDERVESSAGAQGRMDVISILWTTGTDVEVTVSVPDMVVHDASVDNDELTLTNCGRSTNEGVWKITSVAIGTDELTFTVIIPARVDALDDETDTGAFGAIYTHALEIQNAEVFLPGDSLQAASLSLQDFEVIGQTGTTVYLRNVRSLTEMPGGLRVRAIRENVYVLPLRDTLKIPKVEPLVPGDSITTTGHARRLRIKKVNAKADLAVTSLVTTTTEATLTISSTEGFDVGRKLLIHDEANGLAGEHTISIINSSTELTIPLPSGATDTGSAVIIGNTIELDESLDEVTDDGISQVFRNERWFPIPTISGEVQPWRATSPSNQSLIKGALSRDSLYFAGSDDPIFKFDGTDISRAGIPRMEVDLFLNKDTGATGTIILNNPSSLSLTPSSNSFELSDADDIYLFRVGDRIESSVDGEIYTVINTSDDTTKPIITVDRNVTGGVATFTRTSSFNYYARLNMIDANGGLVASAVVGSNDLRTELGADAAVHLRFHNFPNLDSFDFDRLELEIFRTRANTSGPYFKITTLPLKNETNTYVNFTDTTPDAVFTNSDLDPISTALEGQELGVQWEGPLPSKYVTAVDNRVVTANCTGWPTIDFRLKRQGLPVDASDMNGVTVGIKRDSSAVSEDITFEFENTIDSSISLTGGDSAFAAVSPDEYVYLFQVNSDGSLESTGWFQADGDGTLSTGDSFTGTREMVRVTGGNIPVYVNDLNVGEDHNWPKQNLIGGSLSSLEGQSARRLAGAINWWQSTLSDAYLTAAAGGDFEFGQFVLKSPRFEETTFEVTISLNGAGLDIFANGLLRNDAEGISAFTRLFPSRLLVSEVNFPDIFNAPDVDLDVLSRGVIDVNPSDGEIITGISSFFGDSTTAQSALQGILVVFKESSIYTVDVSSGLVQKLETEGKGCTVPGSIVSTKGGIMFANLSGIYLLTPQMQINFVGRRFDRKWKDLGTTNFSVAAGSLKNSENKYLLRLGDTTVVYDTTRTYESGMGSFSTYTNHDAVAWSNFGDDHIWSSERGSVLIARTTNTDKDYLDEGVAVSSQLTWRPLSFGDSTLRKVISSIMSHFRVLTSSNDVTVSTQVDLDGNFEPCDTNTIEQALGGLAGRSLQTLRSSPPTPRGLFFSIRWESAEAKPFEISGFGLRVAGLSNKGTREGGST